MNRHAFQLAPSIVCQTHQEHAGPERILLTHIDLGYEEMPRKFPVTHFTHKNMNAIHYTTSKIGLERKQIISIFNESHLSIISPFNQLASIANELAICALLEGNALTIKAMGVLRENKLYMICGPNEELKRAVIHEKNKENASLKVISYDHIVLERIEGKIYCMTPVWDRAFKEEEKRVHEVKGSIEVLLVDKVLLNYTGLKDLIPYIVGVTFGSEEGEIEKKIYSLLAMLPIKVKKDFQRMTQFA